MRHDVRSDCYACDVFTAEHVNAVRMSTNRTFRGEVGVAPFAVSHGGFPPFRRTDEKDHGRMAGRDSREVVNRRGLTASPRDLGTAKVWEVDA